MRNSAPVYAPPLRLSAHPVACIAACLALGCLSHLARAEDVTPPEPRPSTCPSSVPNPAPEPSKPPAISVKPKFVDAYLDENDEIAALEAIRVALTEVGDGNSYVWYRRHGRLSGIVQPTASFKDAAGRVCRHILLFMTAGAATGRAEGTACRLGDGRWQLDG